LGVHCFVVCVLRRPSRPPPRLGRSREPTGPTAIYTMQSPFNAGAAPFTPAGQHGIVQPPAAVHRSQQQYPHQQQQQPQHSPLASSRGGSGTVTPLPALAPSTVAKLEPSARRWGQRRESPQGRGAYGCRLGVSGSGRCDGFAHHFYPLGRHAVMYCSDLTSRASHAGPGYSEHWNTPCTHATSEPEPATVRQRHA
jgi:hypothetical protein